MYQKQYRIKPNGNRAAALKKTPNYAIPEYQVKAQLTRHENS